MGVFFHMDSDGGFTAGNTSTGETAYAYPSSGYAVAAKRNPHRVAWAMTTRGVRGSAAIVAESDARNWARLVAAGAISPAALADHLAGVRV